MTHVPGMFSLPAGSYVSLLGCRIRCLAILAGKGVDVFFKEMDLLTLLVVRPSFAHLSIEHARAQQVGRRLCEKHAIRQGICFARL